MNIQPTKLSYYLSLFCSKSDCFDRLSVIEVESAGESDFDAFVWNMPSKGCLRMVTYQTGAGGLEGDIKFAAMWVWGLVGAVLLIVVIVGVWYIKKRQQI